MNYYIAIIDKDSKYITKIIDKYFKCDVLFAKKVGEGFYEVVYFVKLLKNHIR